LLGRQNGKAQRNGAVDFQTLLFLG
jgi:hypothetical protein